MKTTLKLIPIVIMVGLCQCADTYTWENRVEPRPFINGVKDRFTLLDSIKTHFKSGGGVASTYAFTLSSSNPIPKTLFVDKISGGTLLIDDAGVRDGAEIPLSKDKMSVKCLFKVEGETESMYTLEFRIKDLGSWVGSVTTVQIKAFRNLLPVARCTVTKTIGNSYTFDASSSYDRDQRFGGRIGTFQYSITGAENRTFPPNNQSVFTYGFPIKGDYRVTLVVRDNDAGDSEPFSVPVSVN